MRIIPILTIVTITALALAYNFIEDAAFEQPHAVTPLTKANSGLETQDQLDKLASVLQRYQQTDQEQAQQAQLQQTRLNKMLADLDARLRSLETISGSVISNTDEQNTDEAVSSSSKDANDLQVSEADVGKWMDETLRVGNWDQDKTKQATYEAEISLEKVPGVNLEDMQCNDLYCRATFTHEDGKQDAILDLFGTPPFENEGFTVNGPDGRVALYVARPGESLEEFRIEAKEDVLEYSD